MDNRHLEVVADGLPLFHGAQLALDTTMATDGAALEQARRKEFRYPELTGEQGRAELWCWRVRLGDGGLRKRKTS